VCSSIRRNFPFFSIIAATVTLGFHRSELESAGLGMLKSVMGVKIQTLRKTDAKDFYHSNCIKTAQGQHGPKENVD
jgi:hypothetical protein